MPVKISVDKVTDDLYILRVDDVEVAYFEALWEIAEGVTYNAYLLVGDGGCILFDSWKARYAGQMVETIRSVVDLRDITHIVIHHMEQDHSGAIPEILRVTDSRPVVLAHPMACQMLGLFYGVNARVRPVKDGEEVDVAGRRLRFIYVPWLHWPETITTYYADQKALLSCDVFGGFSTPDKIFDDDDEVVEKYLPHVRKYFASVIGAYRQHVNQAVQKMAGLDIRLIAPAHGLVWRRDPRRVVNYYEALANGSQERGKVTIICASMYGECLHAARIVMNELKKKRANAKIYEITDTARPSISDLLGDVFDSEAIVVAAPTYESDIFPIARWIIEMIQKKTPGNKSALIISSYGWGEQAGKKLAEMLRAAGHDVKDLVVFRGRPDSETEEKLREATDKLLTE
jgi:flavorubredoxin